MRQPRTHSARLHILGTLLPMLFVSSPAFADTVDAAAQPYLIAGGWAFAGVMLGLGTYFIARGRRNRRLGRASTHWPTAPGKILDGRVADKTYRLNNTTHPKFVPELRYVYEVGDKRLDGSVIRLGLDQFGYASTAEAQAVLDRYPVGLTVPVRYDPDEPATAMLEVGQVGGGRNLFGGSIFFILGLGGAALAIWVAGLATH